MRTREIRGRKYLICIAAAALMICSFLIAGIRVHASSSEDLFNNLELPAMDAIEAAPGSGNESSSSADIEYPSFFLLICDESGKVAGYCQAALVADTDGNFYLITSEYVSLINSDQKYTFKICQGDFSTNVKIAAVQDGIAYLQPDSSEKLLAYKLGRNWDEVKKDAYLWYMKINDSSEQSLTCSRIGDLTGKEQSGNDFVFSKYESKHAAMFGMIMADSKAKSAVGMVTLDSGHKNLIIKNLDNIEHPQKAAVGTDSQSASGGDDDDTDTSDGDGKDEGSEGGADDGDRDNTDEGDQGSTDDGDQGNTGKEDQNKGIFSEVPYWAWLIAGVVVIGAVLFRGNSKKEKKENAGFSEPADSGPEGGTICLNSDEAMHGSQKTMPQQPLQVSNYLVRGVSGVFQGQIFQIGAVLRFGRGNGSDVMFPQGTRGISSSHCELSLENGRIALRDVGSSYGTYMGQGVKLVPQVVYYLQPGDEFYLADRTQLFRVENINANGAGKQQGLSVKGLDGSVMGQTFFAGVDGKMYFGRGEGNQVHFGNQDTGISTSHCTLYQENGMIYLMDMNSMNGTFKDDGTRLRPNVPYRMHAGDKFYLVNRRNSFRINGD